MTMMKITAPVLLAMSLCACSTMHSPRAPAPAEFEETMIQAMRDAYGPPVESESLPNGEQLDVFVYSDRIASRASFDPGNDHVYPPARCRPSMVRMA